MIHFVWFVPSIKSYSLSSEENRGQEMLHGMGGMCSAYDGWKFVLVRHVYPSPLLACTQSAFKRAIAVPKRGVGDTTIAAIGGFAKRTGLSLIRNALPLFRLSGDKVSCG